MLKHKVLRPVTVATIGLTMALGTLPAASAAPAPAQYKATVLNIGSDATQRNVVWYSTSAGEQVARIAVKGDAATSTTVAPVRTGAAQDAGWTYHQATFEGLAPQTTYTYQVGSDVDGWSDTFEFSTQADGDFDFLVYGDAQIGSGGGQPTDGAAWQQTLTTSTERFPGADFLLSVGDQVDTDDSEAEYADFLAPDELREYPLATNVGNHDVGIAYGEHFNMPNADPTAGAQHAGLGDYWYIYNDVLFLSLNSNVRDNQQHFDWMRDVLAEHGQDAEWKVVTWHHGLYSTASHATDGDIEKRREDMPLEMSELDVDLVLSGHDHVYTRSHLIHSGHPVGDLTAPGELAKFPGEVLYLTSNSSTGSKYYTVQDVDFPFNAVTSQNRTPSYTHVEVTDGALHAVTYQVDGTVLDDVTLTRAPEDATPNPVPEGPAQTVFEPEPAKDAPVPSVVDPETGAVSVEGRILTGNDDVEQSAATGEMYLDSSDLEVTEESPGEADPERQVIGLRYDELGIPAGATITSAHLQFTVDEADRSADPFDVTIAAENAGHSRPFTEDAGNVTSREFLDTTVAWTGAPLWTTNGEAGPDQRTPDLTELVQGVVDNEGWARGSALTLALSGVGNRTAEAYEGGTGAEAPKLFVTYTLDGRTEVEAKIQTENDDVEQYGTSGEMDHGSSDLEIVDEKENQLVGLRYAGLDIPAGARITSAHVQLTTDEADKNTDPFAVNVFGEAADSSAAFGAAGFDLTNRARTAASAAWTDVPAWTMEQESGADQRTPDLSAVIQEIVDRDAWAAGNALTLLLEGTGTRSAEAFEGGGQDEAPVLWVTYELPDEQEPAKTRGKSADAPGHNKDTMHDRGRSAQAPGHNK
ncbi:fibronectin type III domain-containing protein [Georgenia sp. SYP-B2076]|uniref:fibronectin type III domain-containing protein n=1 Tax=Georgenia sp. SYP-B2076 TaxID=2495881 RepID=UPI000F8C4C86|nr:fibronectin type III domain-containing protein [Georgenia sp. SYP-B2076]